MDIESQEEDCRDAWAYQQELEEKQKLYEEINTYIKENHEKNILITHMLHSDKWMF